MSSILRKAKVERLSFIVMSYYNNFFDEITKEKISTVIQLTVPTEWQEEIIKNLHKKIDNGLI